MKKKFGPAPYILSFPKFGKYRAFSRLSLMAHSPMLEFQSEKVIGNIKVRTI